MSEMIHSISKVGNKLYVKVADNLGNDPQDPNETFEERKMRELKYLYTLVIVSQDKDLRKLLGAEVVFLVPKHLIPK